MGSTSSTDLQPNPAWAMANIALALLCVVTVDGAYMFRYVVAGPLVIVVSFALVVHEPPLSTRRTSLESKSLMPWIVIHDSDLL